jgi:hypothetical protein
MIRAALVLCGAASLLGCAGQAAYSVKPFYEPNLQKMVCCEAIALNSKDISSLSFDLTTSADGPVVVHFVETGVGATAPTAAQGAVISNVATAASNAAAAIVKLTP